MDEIEEIKNFFKKNLVTDFSLYFEYDLFKMIRKKFPRFKIIINPEPTYLRLENINIKQINSSVLNKFDINLTKQHEDNVFSLEPCFISNIPIMEIYYKLKNIKYEKVTETVVIDKDQKRLNHLLNVNLYKIELNKE